MSASISGTDSVRLRARVRQSAGWFRQKMLRQRLLCGALAVVGWWGVQPAFADDTKSNTPPPSASKQQSDPQKKKTDPDPVQKHKAIETVVVEGQRTPAAVARQAQKEAPNLINIQTYQEIRKLPDVDVAEAVRRVPGISAETDEGESRYINIRGFDADLNSTTFGGLRLPPTNNASPFNGYRAVTLDSIPIGLVGAITVTKSNLPDMDAEDLGGTIEITPKTAPPGGAPFIQGNVGTGYEPLRSNPLYDFAVTAGGRFGGPTNFFGDGPFSVVATISWYEDRRGIDDVEPGYFNDGAHPFFAINNIQQRDYELHRARHSYGIDFGYQPDDNSNYYVRAFEAGYWERYKRQFLNLTPDGKTSTNPDGTLHDTLQATTTLGDGVTQATTAIQKAFRDERETELDRVLVAGGKNTLGNGALLDYRVGYVIGSYVKPFDVNSAFDFVPPSGLFNATIDYGLKGEGQTPLYTISGADFTNPNNFFLDPTGLVNSTARNFDKEYSFAANFEQPLNWLSGDNEAIKVGIDVRLRHKGEVAQPTSYGGNLPPLPLTAASFGPREIYYDGQYQNGVDIIPGFLQKMFGPGTISPSDAMAAAQQFLDAREYVYAGYVQYRVDFGDLGLAGGVRVEQTVDHTHAFAVDSHGVLPPVPVNGEKNYTNVFPSLQARYEIEPDLIARATYSSTLARPGFNQFTPATTFDLGGLTLTTGNPALRAATANSFDVTLEKYLEDAGILSIGFFDKEIRNYIVPNTLTGQVPPVFLGIHDPVTLVTFTNAGPSYARGVEFNWMERFDFDFMPDFLDGLGAGANFTYVDSSYQIRPATNPGEQSRLPSTSRWTWNATVFYENGPVTLRLAAYSVSADLFGIGGDRTGDIFNSSRTSMDFGSSYAFDDNHLVLYFNAKNLLNTPHAFYQGTSNRPIQREFYLQTYQLGVRFDF